LSRGEVPSAKLQNQKESRQRYMMV
jgi:hypothetical protein